MSTTEVFTATGGARLVGSLTTPEEPEEGPWPREAKTTPHYRSICVPLDGSSESEHALPVARSLARRLSARLSLVHVHQPGADRAYTGRAEYAFRENEQRCEESRYLWSKVDRGDREPGTAAVLMSGRVPEALLRFVREQEADLVVMTTHGAGGMGRPWLGSVADRMLRSARVPVIVAPAAAAAPDVAKATIFRRILVPLDGSGAAEEVIEHALALGELCGASYSLVQVDQPLQRRRAAEAPAEGETGRVGQAAQRYLDYVATRLRDRGLSVDTRVLLDSRPAEAILAAAAETGADLLALTLHGEGGKQRRLFGSVADKVIRASSLPLLVYRPRGGKLVPRVA
ncbi:MAG TPA: universal stress protein [Longimicrobiales bacterium]